MLKFRYHKHVQIAFSSAIGLFLLIFVGGLIVQHALAYSFWTQSDWSGGVGSSTTNQYSSGSNVSTSTADQVTMAPNTSSWYGTSWNDRQSITISAAMVSATQTNFPVLISISSDPNLASSAQSSGNDILFTDSTGTNKLNSEIESYNSSTGALIAWVNVPSLSSISNTTLYMYYGNSGATSQQNPSGVWSNYLGVWHLNNPTVPLDSTINAQNGTDNGATSTTGNIAGAGNFNGSSSNITLPLNPSTSQLTVSLWFKANSLTGDNPRLIANDHTDKDSEGFQLMFNEGGGTGFFDVGNGTSAGSASWTKTLVTGQWYNYVGVYNGSAVYAYINGVQVGTSSFSGTIAAGTNNISVGYDVASGGDYFNGSIDEVQISNTALSSSWVNAEYNNQNSPSTYETIGSQQIHYSTSGSLVSNIYNTNLEENWGNLTYSETVPTNTSVAVLVRAGNQPNLSDAPAFTSCSTIASGSAITSACAPDKSQYVQYELEFTSNGNATPTFTSISVSYTPSDLTPPETNATNIEAYDGSSGASVASNGWINTDPYFTWTAATDHSGGSGIAGYCIYLGQSSSGNPVTSSGVLSTSSPLNTGGACPFAVSSTDLDTSLSGYLSSALLSSTGLYYINIVAITGAGIVWNGSATQFEFYYDNTPPINPTFITAPSEFVSTDEVTLTWPTSGSDAPSDAISGVAGLQYKIGASGIWYGVSHNGNQDMTDLLPNDGSYTTIDNPDFGNLVEGNNIIYFRTWNNAGVVSPAYVTTVIKINTTSPSTPQNLTATPTTNTTNSFGFSWLAPASFTGTASNITYCYTINILPNSTDCNFTAAGQTSLSPGAYATEPKDNTFYLVAKDEAGNINYATAASTTFTANTPAPGIPLNTDIADISVKATNTWKLAISWDVPSTVGAGIASYKVFRSTDGTNYTQIASTAGASYVDTGLSQQTYYYEIQACDSADNCGGLTSSVSDFPTGKFTSPANLISGPDVSVNTRSATITWTTDRVSNSSIEYGLSSGVYFSTDASNSNQVTSHSIDLNNLSADTTYYYSALWTDEDGNIGTSAENVFTTLPAPTVSNVTISNINLTNATITFTSSNATAVELDYGNWSLGSTQNLNTSTNTSTYSIPLSGLNPGTTYSFKLNPYDTSGNIYDSPATYTFTTPPQPTISNIQFSPVPGALTGTENIFWSTNVPTTSQISYGLLNEARSNQLDTTLTTNHEMTISDLTYNTQYSVTATSVDALGNVANSDLQVFKSGIDTRPPVISAITVQPSIVGNGANAKGQLIVSWKTDKAGTSQVAYGNGAAGNYTTTTAENPQLVNNHVVVIYGIATSEVYHVQVISKDADGIRGVSTDQTTIIGQASDNALSIVFNSLQNIFGL